MNGISVWTRGAGAILALGLAVSGAAIAQESGSEPAQSYLRDTTFERDREAILGMAGDFDVKFDFIETVALDPDYELAERDISGGTEMVRVLEDTGEFISLQHTLVMHIEGMDEAVVVKHWRQDWSFQPDSVLLYRGHDLWTAEEVPMWESQGAWSQTVYQVDDSPRYAAVARWAHDGEVSTWEPPAEWRPLPRRDDTTRTDYDVIDGVNRHTVTPWAWWHEQDNSKIVLEGEETRELVREVGVNSYVRKDDLDMAAGEEYWDKTGAFWAGVRDEWTRLENTGRLSVADNAEGELLYIPVLEVADTFIQGEIDDRAALARAVMLIRTQTATGETAGPLTREQIEAMAAAVREEDEASDASEEAEQAG